MKNKIVFFMALFLVSSSYADFTFQDNTFRSQLRVCYGGNCTNLNDMNTTGWDIDSVYEVRNDRIDNFDLWDFIVQNPQTVVFFFLLIAVSIVGVYIVRRKT